MWTAVPVYAGVTALLVHNLPPPMRRGAIPPGATCHVYGLRRLPWLSGPSRLDRIPRAYRVPVQ